MVETQLCKGNKIQKRNEVETPFNIAEFVSVLPMVLGLTVCAVCDRRLGVVDVDGIVLLITRETTSQIGHIGYISSAQEPRTDVQDHDMRHLVNHGA